MLKALFSLKVLAIIASLALAASFGGILIFGEDGGGDNPHTAPQVEKTPTDLATHDSDGDGLTDQEERIWRVNTSSENSPYAVWSDPSKPDTDEDGVNDGIEVRRGMSPTRSDTDFDALNDATELQLETDPKSHDSDGDGLSDGMEVHNGSLYPDADPLRMDIYVEVDAIQGAILPRDEADRIVQAFDAAPVRKNGKQGIGLHIVYSDINIEKEHEGAFYRYWLDRLTESSPQGYYEGRYFDHDSQGYHYALIVPELERVDFEQGEFIQVGGVGSNGTFNVEYRERGHVTGTRFMHELGHSLGLRPARFNGIDSTKYSAEEYRSVQNYNFAVDGEVPYSARYRYSSSEPFNDWEYINSSMYTPSTYNVT